MSNLYDLDILPPQNTINLIASYSKYFERESFNYPLLLEKLNATMLSSHFMEKQDNAAWMNHQGSDYIGNPKLFAHAPLTYLCAFLSEVFKQRQVKDIEKRIPPKIFRAALKRLNEFK
ncbi:hypothetical protein E2R68_10360 [Psychromonas sp. RZ22]|uniref:hypothetical protein n=1 Tax=Psychromonas algarum TaxID=2555643 RepID=UPI0010677958|nr:hypothetical protein [Psychromonas sp. RZ22]TEW53885.1 hypothetical protein E2R68_10360 [Psychromonas sp. RZ22]